MARSRFKIFSKQCSAGTGHSEGVFATTIAVSRKNIRPWQ